MNKNGAEVIRRLEPIRKPLQRNRFSFKYLLIIGRGVQKSKSQSLRDRLVTLEDSDFNICTYDSLISHLEFNRAEKKNILRLTKNYYEFKYLSKKPFNMLAFLSPDDIHINSEQKELLMSWGYEIDEWERGEHLLDGKKTSKSLFAKNHDNNN